jgi:CheY-like chemotaxis protein
VLSAALRRICRCVAVRRFVAVNLLTASAMESSVNDPWIGICESGREPEQAAAAISALDPGILRVTEALLDRAETILLVEDEAFVRDVTREVLTSAGYKVLIAKNAAEAAHIHDRCAGQLDLLLSDIILPGENGRALARRLKQKNPELRVLLVTGYAEYMNPGEAAHHPENCLAKPFSAGTLLQGVRQVLDGEMYPPTPVCGNA